MPCTFYLIKELVAHSHSVWNVLTNYQKLNAFNTHIYKTLILVDSADFIYVPISLKFDEQVYFEKVFFTIVIFVESTMWIIVSQSTKILLLKIHGEHQTPYHWPESTNFVG